MSVNFGKVAPAMYQGAELNAQAVTIDAAKGIGTSFNGYGIAEGETITFPTMEQLESGEFLIKRKTSPKSKRWGLCVRVIREDAYGERESYFNLSQLERMMYLDKEGKNRVHIDDVRAEMSKLPDHVARAIAMAGKKIKGIDTKDGYAPEFKDGARVPGGFVEAKFTVIEYA